MLKNWHLNSIMPFIILDVLMFDSTQLEIVH